MLYSATERMACIQCLTGHRQNTCTCIDKIENGLVFIIEDRGRHKSSKGKSLDRINEAEENNLIRVFKGKGFEYSMQPLGILCPFTNGPVADCAQDCNACHGRCDNAFVDSSTIVLENYNVYNPLVDRWLKSCPDNLNSEGKSVETNLPDSCHLMAIHGLSYYDFIPLKGSGASGTSIIKRLLDQKEAVCDDGRCLEERSPYFTKRPSSAFTTYQDQCQNEVYHIQCKVAGETAVRDVMGQALSMDPEHQHVIITPQRYEQQSPARKKERFNNGTSSDIINNEAGFHLGYTQAIANDASYQPTLTLDSLGLGTIYDDQQLTIGVSLNDYDLRDSDNDNDTDFSKVDPFLVNISSSLDESMMTMISLRATEPDSKISDLSSASDRSSLLPSTQQPDYIGKGVRQKRIAVCPTGGEWSFKRVLSPQDFPSSQIQYDSETNRWPEPQQEQIDVEDEVDFEESLPDLITDPDLSSEGDSSEEESEESEELQQAEIRRLWRKLHEGQLRHFKAYLEGIRYDTIDDYTKEEYNASDDDVELMEQATTSSDTT